MDGPFSFLRSWVFLAVIVGGVAVIWPQEVWEWVTTVASVWSLGRYMPN